MTLQTLWESSQTRLIEYTFKELLYHKNVLGWYPEIEEIWKTWDVARQTLRMQLAFSIWQSCLFTAKLELNSHQTSQDLIMPICQNIPVCTTPAVVISFIFSPSDKWLESIRTCYYSCSVWRCLNMSLATNYSIDSDSFGNSCSHTYDASQEIAWLHNQMQINVQKKTESVRSVADVEAFLAAHLSQFSSKSVKPEYSGCVTCKDRNITVRCWAKSVQFFIEVQFFTFWNLRDLHLVRTSTH